jgi:hypothetical protein
LGQPVRANIQSKQEAKTNLFKGACPFKVVELDCPLTRPF